MSLSLIPIVILLLIYIKWDLKLPKKFFIITTIAITSICIRILIQNLETINYSNIINSFLVLPVYFLCIYLLSEFFKIIVVQDFIYGLRIIFNILLLLSWINILFPIINVHLGYTKFNHPFFPFHEPSHYATSILPIAAGYGIISTKRTRIFIILNLIAQSLLIPNLTLFVSALILFILFWLREIGIKRIIFILSGALIFVFQSNSYFTSRLSNFSANSDNLSVLTYIQGWAEILKGLKDSYGFGLGYRMMGTNSPTSVGVQIEKLGFDSISRSDGSFLFSKLTTEFGLIAIIMVIFWLIKSYKLFVNIQPNKNIPKISKVSVLISINLALLLELFFRGGDYFSSTTMLGLSSFIALISSNEKEK